MTENEWNEMIERVAIKELEGKIDGLEREHFHVVVKFTLDNIEKHPRICELIKSLELASEKLELYRNQHSGEYVGGMEYMMLQNNIKQVLAKFKAGEK
jgi:hypothetical protein